MGCLDLIFLSNSSYICHMISHGDDRNKINTIFPLEWTVASRQRVTVKKECRSQRGYQQMLVLSNLRSPDTRGKEGEAKWLAGTLKRKWHLLPVGEKNDKKSQLLERARGRQTHSHYSGWRRQKHISDTRDPSSSSQC